MNKPENFEKVIKTLAEKLKGHKYAIRGTASLLLQGCQMNVDDIDIVCDKKTALLSPSLIGEKYVTEQIKYSESPSFRSYFGKFLIDKVKIEVMGEWEIKRPDGTWTTPFDGSDRLKIRLNYSDVWVSTIESELKMFAAMGRWNAYHKIKKAHGEHPVL